MDSVRGTLRIRDVLGTWGTLQTAIHGVHLSYCFLLQPRTLVGGRGTEENFQIKADIMEGRFTLGQALCRVRLA